MIEEKIDKIVYELRKHNNTSIVGIIFGSLCASGFILGISLYLHQQSFYYLFTYTPYLLIIITTLIFGLPYPLDVENNIFNIYLYNDDNLMYEQLSEFSIGCIIIAPFAIISILYILLRSSTIVLVFQILSHFAMMCACFVIVFIYYKPLPPDDDFF